MHPSDEAWIQWRVRMGFSRAATEQSLRDYAALARRFAA